MRYAAFRERKFVSHCLKSELAPMVGTDIFMDRLRASLSKPVASCAHTADDHRVNGGATSATAVESTTRCMGGMLARKVRRRATKE
jgi:hypothetical protein